jgi:hypothetical protein
VKLEHFFFTTAINITTDDTMSLLVDKALHINRQYLIGEVMIKVGQKLVKEGGLEEYLLGSTNGQS